MVGTANGLIAKIRQMNPDVKHSHCAIHKEALATRYLPEPFKVIFDSGIKIINFIRARAKNHRVFRNICEELEEEYGDLLLYTEVRWLSKGKSFHRLYKLRTSVQAFGNTYDFTKKEIQNGKQKHFEEFEEENFLIILAYLCDIFDKLNVLNTNLQGNPSDY